MVEAFHWGHNVPTSLKGGPDMRTDTVDDHSHVPPTELPRPSPLTLPVVLVGVVLVAMSISGTAVALPSIGEDLTASGSALNWVVAGYNLAFAAMTLVAGSTADKVGRRLVFVGAATIFSAGSILAATSPVIVVVDIARIVSGIGGAGIMAAGGAILASAYAGDALNRAFALMGTMAGVGIAVGPSLAGVLISLTGWRGSFLLFAAVGLIIAAGATRLGESHADGGRTDWFGSIVFIVSLSAIMFAVIEGPTIGWTDGRTLSAFATGLILLALFGIAQRRSSTPVLAPSLLTNHGFLGWSLATLTTSIGFLGALVFLPSYLQAVSEFSPVLSGVAMLLLTAPVLVMPMIAGHLVNAGVSAKALMLAALVLVVAGNLALLSLSPDNTIAIAAGPLLMIGIGMGTSFGITDAQAMGLVPPDMVGMAAGFLNTLRGAAEALVIAGFSASLLGFLSSRLGDPDRASVVSSGRLGTDPGPEIDAFTWSWHMTQLVIGILCLALSVIVALLILRKNPPVNSARADQPSDQHGE